MVSRDVHTLLLDSEVDALEPMVLRLGSATIFNFLTPFSTASGLPALGFSSTSIFATDGLLEEADVGEGVVDADILPKASLSFSLVSLSCDGVLDGGVRVPPAALRLFLVFTVLPAPVVALEPSAPNTLSLGVTT